MATTTTDSAAKQSTSKGSIKRSRNYTTSETELLLELAGKKKSILNGRLSSTVTADKKKRIWIGIAKEINGVNGQNDRSPQDLKKKWQNIINSAKTKERLNKDSRRKTGGGPSEGVALTTVDQMALANVSSVQVEGINGGFQSNTIRDLDRESPFTGDSSGNNQLQTDFNDISTGQHAANLRTGAIGEGLRAVYGSVQIMEDEDAAMMYSSRFCHLSGENDEDDEMNADGESVCNDFGNDDETQPPSSPDLFAMHLPTQTGASPSATSQQNETLLPLPEQTPAQTPITARTAVTRQSTTPGPIRSNRTVTRDIRRSEFKEILVRKDKLNELVGRGLGTLNVTMAQILEELKKLNNK